MNHPAPRKSLGQHFLESKEVVERIIFEFDPRSDDVVLEIGPGPGALTFELIPRVARLHAVELDADLARRLDRATADLEHVHVHHADALKTDLEALCPKGRLRVIGNLPYNISSPLLFHLLQARHRIRDMLLMLQKEVGERIAAEPGSRRYGRLSVMVQQACRVETVIDVGRDAFFPPPQVESVVVRISPFLAPPHPLDDHGAFERVVRQAFSQRRKTLRNALAPLLTGRQLDEAGIDQRLRPEQLDVGSYVSLSKLL